jgi:hypothetical protein
VVRVLETRGATRRTLRRLTVSSVQPVADEMEVFNADGRAVGSVSYSDYRFPPADAEAGEAPPARVAYPGCLTLHTADDRRSMRMKVEDLTLNTPVQRRHFEIQTPEGQKVLDLGQALHAGKSLWE